MYTIFCNFTLAFISPDHDCNDSDDCKTVWNVDISEIMKLFGVFMILYYIIYTCMNVKSPYHAILNVYTI